MEKKTVVLACRAIVDRLDLELVWELDADVRQRYAVAVAELIDAEYSDDRLETIVRRYHEDHARVKALCDEQHPGHMQAWDQTTKEIEQILRRAGQAWSSDPAVAADDHIQIACEAVAQAVGSFRYASRFSTWLTQVTVRRVQRSIRDSLAQKRSGRPESIEGLDAAIPEQHQPETEAVARTLIAEVIAILKAHPDQRLAQIFVLWAEEDMPIVEIGKRVSLHPSRVRVLLAEARKLLRQHPGIQDWRSDDS